MTAVLSSRRSMIKYTGNELKGLKKTLISGVEIDSNMSVRQTTLFIT